MCQMVGPIQRWIVEKNCEANLAREEWSSTLTTVKLIESRYKLVLQAAYCPDLALCDFFLFQILKISLAGQEYESKEVVAAYFADLHKTYFSYVLMKLEFHRVKRIELKRDCCEINPRIRLKRQVACFNALKGSIFRRNCFAGSWLKKNYLSRLSDKVSLYIKTIIWNSLNLKHLSLCNQQKCRDTRKIP